MRVPFLLFCFLFVFRTLLFPFTLQPWYSSFAEFESRIDWAFRSYPPFDQRQNAHFKRLHDWSVHLNGGMQFWPNWEMQIQSDFLKTQAFSWRVERFGVQMRTLLLNDVSGDPISFSLGLQGYYVPTKALRQLALPYHAQGNIELGLSMGKEVSRLDEWIIRFFYFLGFGIGNRGFPWARPLVSVEMKVFEKGRFGLFSEGYFGFGRSHWLSAKDFNGYGEIAHRSIDCGLQYTHRFKIWGNLSFQYTERLHAVFFLSRVRVFQIEYRLPFSLF